MYTRETFDVLINSVIERDVTNEELIHKLLLFEENSDQLDEGRVFNIYHGLDHLFCIDGDNQDLERAFAYNQKAEALIEERSDIDKAKHFFTKGHIYARRDDYPKSKEAFIKYVYYRHKDGSDFSTQTPVDISRNSRVNEFGQTFYSFRTVNKYMLSDLINQEITLANPNEFNDPFDPLLFKFLELHRERILKESHYDIRSLCDAYKCINIRCFVRDLNTDAGKAELAHENNLMWAHYADSFKGICILYRFSTFIKDSQIPEKEFCSWHDVEYPPILIFKDEVSASAQYLFATKHEKWRYEKEVRLIHFKTDRDEKFTHIPLSKLGGKIEAVFFGLRCPEKDIKTIKSILGADVEYLEFEKEVKPNTEIDKLELVNPDKFNDLNKTNMIGFKRQ